MDTNSQNESERNSGLLAVLERAKAHLPLKDYTGVVVWEGGDEICLHDDLGVQMGCWTLTELIRGKIVNEGTALEDRENALYVMSCILKKLGQAPSDSES